MRDNAVALVLTFSEAGALFETANLGMKRRDELGMGTSKKAMDALAKIAVGMGYTPKVDGVIMNLGPPNRDQPDEG
jgi:hypothetical protein